MAHGDAGKDATLMRWRSWLRNRRQQGLRRACRPLLRPAAGRCRIDGAECVDFSSNDYLGLSHHPLLKKRAAAWARTFGTGSAASRLVSGSLEPVHALEKRLAAWKERPSALIMNSGFQANATVLEALFDRRILGAPPLVFTDRLIHASMHFGCKAAGVRQIRYRHNDVDHLATLLQRHATDASPRFILTESVFSMDGDIAPLDEIAALARRHGALLIVDDAHASGVMGTQGRGLAQQADIVIGTFGKALGSFGAWVTCDTDVRDYLVNRCAGFIYSTAPPPPVLGAIDAALEIVPGMEEERRHVRRLAEMLRAELAALGLSTLASRTHIVPLVVEDAQAALDLARHLRRHGLFAPAIRPPTVPPGTARLRLSVTAAHAERDIDHLLRAVAEWRVSRARGTPCSTAENGP